MKTPNEVVLEVATEMMYTSMQNITAETIYNWATRLVEAMCSSKIALKRVCDVYTEDELCEIITTEAQSELSEDTPQGFRDIVDIVAKGVIKSLFAKAEGFFKETIEKAHTGIDWDERKKGEVK
jgi:hypothetical protein